VAKGQNTVMKLTVANSFRLIAFAATMVALSSCYVPDDYAAEIRITRSGNYGISYTGTLTWAPLFGQIARREIDAAAAAEQSAGFLRALKEDGNFTSVVSLGKGQYDVRYDRRGRFTRTQMVSFVRRNARIFQIRAIEDGCIFVFGTRAGSSQADQLEAAGLTTQGLVRVVTDAPVLEHNAMSVRPSPTPGYSIYEWRQSSFRQPAPKLTLKIDGKLATTAPG
jgi:hypothetical protein